MRVLLLEPNQPLGQVYTTALAQAGHEPIYVTSAQTAVRAMDEQTPDVIVLELQLVGHSGIEFLYELRSYPEWQHIPVVLHSMVSASTLGEQAAQLQELGVIAHLYKPATTLRKLLQAVNDYAPVS